MSTVDLIYELIKKDNSVNTLNNNKDLFIKFYYNEMSLYYGSNKVKEIYKYLLSVDVDPEIFPTLKRDIFSDFNRYETNITQAFYMGKFEINNDVIKKLYELIELYNDFKVYDINNQMISIDKFTRDYTGSMIIALNKGIFNIDKNYIKSMVECIKNNIYIKNIVNNNIPNGIMDRDYIFQYLSRFLFTSEFVNIDSLNNDLLLKSLFNGVIKDKKFIKKAFNSVDIGLIFSNMDISVSDIIDMLDNVFDSELEKIDFFKTIYAKLEEKNMYRELLNFMICDLRHKMYLQDEDKKKIIEKCALGYLDNITDEEARFLILNCDDKNFLRNLKVDLKSKDNTWSEYTINLVKEHTKDIDIQKPTIEEGLKFFDKLFNGEEVNQDEIINAFIIFSKYVLNDDDLKIYVVKSDSYNGCAYDSSNAIALNIDIINELLNCKDYENNPNKLWVIDTIFHELRHIVQFKAIENEYMDDDLYEIYKEDILMNYNNGYYNQNYVGISFEKDARIIGAQHTFLFLQKFFPNMIKCIEYYKAKFEEEISKTYENAKMFELSKAISKEYVFDLLVSLNPSIVDKHKQLSREYDENGEKKEISNLNNKI